MVDCMDDDVETIDLMDDFKVHQFGHPAIRLAGEKSELRFFCIPPTSPFYTRRWLRVAKRSREELEMLRTREAKPTFEGCNQRPGQSPRDIWEPGFNERADGYRPPKLTTLVMASLPFGWRPGHRLGAG